MEFWLDQKQIFFFGKSLVWSKVGVSGVCFVLSIGYWWDYIFNIKGVDLVLFFDSEFIRIVVLLICRVGGDWGMLLIIILC